MDEWIESEWFKKWLELAHEKPFPPEVGFWYYDSQQQKWIFQKPD